MTTAEGAYLQDITYACAEMCACISSLQLPLPMFTYHVAGSKGDAPHTGYRLKNFPAKGNPYGFPDFWVSEAVLKMGIGIGTKGPPIGFHICGYR